MMGGLTFIVNNKMCVGIPGNDLMARIDPEIYESALKRKGCRKMTFIGRPVRGFVFVNPEGSKTIRDLEFWLNLALEYNKKAKAHQNVRGNSSLLYFSFHNKGFPQS